MKSPTMPSPKETTRQQASAQYGCIVPDKKMLGKFVALRSFTDNTVVASGTDAGRVMQAAKRKKVKSPVVMFIPAKKMVCMY